MTNVGVANFCFCDRNYEGPPVGSVRVGLFCFPSPIKHSTVTHTLESGTKTGVPGNMLLQTVCYITAGPITREQLCNRSCSNDKTHSSVPYRTHPACAKMAAYPDPHL